MGLFGRLFRNTFKAVLGKWGKSNIPVESDEDAEEIIVKSEAAKVMSKITATMAYATKADESYRLLLYENLRYVPAVDLYDGSYVDRLEDELTQLEVATKIEQVEKVNSKLTQIATEIQTYLNEETSDLQSAKLWDSKFVKGVKEHIPPHFKGVREYEDATMSEVMMAFRNWTSFAQSVIDMYGSQRLINATYEAVEDGKDAMSYMSEILDLNQRSSGFGGGLHERVIVPNAGFFGDGFFF